MRPFIADEGVAAVVEHAAHDGVEVSAQRGGQVLEGLGREVTEVRSRNQIKR
jgi:hypothetical protein